jgi:hypothetical protein
MPGSGAGTSRDVYQMSLTPADTERAVTVIAGIFCPDPDHAEPCPVPWSGPALQVGR